MFKNEIKFIYDFNLNEVKKLGNFITYDQLLSANLHPAILQYISADVDYLIFEDRQKILRNSIFDYSGEKIQQQFSLIGEEIKHTKRFSLDYMAKLILHASSFTVNFVVRPRWALTKFIFDDENHKNTTEIKQILNYLYYYGHMRRIIISYINRKKILSINEKEFDELLSKIDTLSVESNARTIVQSSLKAMADFFNIGENSTRSTIPLKAVELFLTEKKFDKHIAKLKSVYGEEDKRIGLIDCLKVLDEEMFSKVDVIESVETKSLIEDDIESETLIEAQEEITENKKSEEQPVMSELESGSLEEEIPILDSEETDPDELNQEQEQPVDLLPEIEEGFKIVGKSPSSKEKTGEKISEPSEEPAKLNENLLLDFEKSENKKKEEEPLSLFSFVSEEETSNPALSSQDEINDDDFEENIQNLFDELSIDEPTSDEIVETDFNNSEENENISTENSFKKTMEIETELIEESEKNEDISDKSNQEDANEEETSDTVLKNLSHAEDGYSAEKVVAEVDVRSRLSEIISVVSAEPEENAGEGEIFEELDITEEADDKEVNEAPDNPEENNIDIVNGTFDISEILENKNLTKVIEVIFDYDIEDFAMTIEKACKAENYQSGIEYLNEVFNNNHVDPQSKEAEALKSVVAEFFNNTK